MIAFFFLLWFAHTPEQQVKFQGGVSGEWLTVERYNCNDAEERGFDPSYTQIISDFKPVTKKLSSGEWEITFVTELP